MRDIILGFAISFLAVIMFCGATLALISNFWIYDEICSRIGFIMFVASLLAMIIIFEIIEKPEFKQA